MILAEIIDKVPPVSLYMGAALVFGAGAAATLTFFRGMPRIIAFGLGALTAALLAWGLQIDADLIEAARIESGQGYLLISRYWIVGSAVIAIILTMMLRAVSRAGDSNRKQKTEAGA